MNVQGEGDCDRDDQCDSGLICVPERWMVSMRRLQNSISIILLLLWAMILFSFYYYELRSHFPSNIKSYDLILHNLQLYEL